MMLYPLSFIFCKNKLSQRFLALMIISCFGPQVSLQAAPAKMIKETPHILQKSQLTIEGAPLLLSENCPTPTTLTVVNHASIPTNSVTIELGTLTEHVRLLEDYCTGQSLAPNGGTCTFSIKGLSQSPPANITVFAHNTPAFKASVEIRQLKIGDVYQQGVVFSVNECNHGKAAALEDAHIESPLNYFISWGNYNEGGETCVPTDAQDHMNGAKNTHKIVEQFNRQSLLPFESYAAGLCYQYTVNELHGTPCTYQNNELCYQNWYLPAIAELHAFWRQTSLNGGSIGHPFKVTDYFYWSSTEVQPCKARGVYFHNGYQGTYNKHFNDRVRCIRTFNDHSLKDNL